MVDKSGLLELLRMERTSRRIWVIQGQEKMGAAPKGTEPQLNLRTEAKKMQRLCEESDISRFVQHVCLICERECVGECEE